jgi:predicted patatin/cPLA2 family phospholipase
MYENTQIIRSKMKKALVISGGGSKGAFAGGVAQYLMQDQQKEYDLFLGTSTGSLLVSHLALGEIDALKELYTSVNQKSIFSINPFRIKEVGTAKIVEISHLRTLWSFLKKNKTFGESKNLLKLIQENLSQEMFQQIKESKKEVIVTVSNFTSGQVEYKALSECTYDDFCEWIWGSCNYIPFMSILEKNGCQYGDGGFGCLVPIREAIERGAKEVDVIILETEVSQLNRIPSKNAFSLLFDVQHFMLDHVERYNITIGKMSANNNDVQLNLYYTPTVLTTNSLIFDKKKMKEWWSSGYEYAKSKDQNLMSEYRAENVED